MKTKIMFCLLLTMTGCTHRGMLPSIPEGTPLKVFAAIDAQQPVQAATTPVGVAADNDYDRSAFVAGDRIRITGTRSGATSGVKDYKFAADGSWSPMADMLVVETGSTYQAAYPAEYTGIYADQRTKTGDAPGENYRMSNLLRTKQGIEATADGVLSFTGENAFVHQHVKLTLEFKGTNPLTQPFSYMTVKGKGLYSSDVTKDESVYLYRPDEGQYVWHGILAALTAASPSEGQQQIAISVTDFNGVEYTHTLTCGRKANSHYKYTLTLKNGILIPVGEEIEEWKAGESHTGKLE